MTKTQLAAFAKFTREYTDKVTKTRDSAVAALKKEGIYTADGALAPEFSSAEQPLAAFLTK
jgi:hypothetical protein